MPGSEQDMHHALAPAVRWHGGTLHHVPLDSLESPSSRG
jgi:hypothetical protein